VAELLVTRQGRVAVLTLNRPEHGNRLTAALAGEAAAALRSLREDDAIRACVLTGEGPVFCLGGDFAGAGPTEAGRRAYADALIALDAAMAELGKALIAAVNGDAHAGGFATAIACDLAVVAEDATLGLPEAASGLFPFIALAIVKDAVPKQVLFDLVYSARLLSAEEARALHLVAEVVPRAAVLDRAVALAESCARHDPEILRLGRDLYYRMRGLGPSEALSESRTALFAALAARDRTSPGRT
jgi:enoyl-CoA hydratase/carnithine racemase